VALPPTKRCEASPGPVVSGEYVAYGLYSPDIFDPGTGKLTPEAIKIDDLRGPSSGHVDSCGHSTGLSVCRSSNLGALDELREVLTQITSRKPSRRIEGYATAIVDEIWNVQKLRPDQRPLNVLDDGRPDYRNHAVIRGATGLGRGALRGPKNDLIELFNRRVVREAE